MKFYLFFLFGFYLICPGIFANLAPTKIVHDGVYKLEIQSEDKFLTGVENSNPIRAVWKSLPEQKWKFQNATDPKSGKDGWTITPVNNIGGLLTLWQVKYVGHGKFQFISYANGMCLRGPGSSAVAEAKCQRDDPGQRWLILQISE